MDSIEEHRWILDLARIVWDNQHEYDLDTVDGTFYWRGCRRELFDQLIEEAQRDPGNGRIRLETAIPGFFSNQGGQRVDEYHIPMRGAVTSVLSLIDRLPSYEPNDSIRLNHKAVVRALIRNAAWTGKDVAEAIHRHWDTYLIGWPADLRTQHLKMLGVGSVEHVTMDMSLQSDRNGRLLDYSEMDSFHFEPGETQVRVAHKPTPDWEFDPRIEVEVSIPPPAKAAIAVWFDDVAITTHGWTSQLMGATNRQDVATAIRAWTFALLKAANISHYDAVREVDEALTGVKTTFPAKIDRDKSKLLVRVPEAEPYL